MDGAMKLDPQSSEVLSKLDGPGIPTISDMSPPQARQWMESFMADMALDPPPGVAAVEDLTAPGPAGRTVPVRLYRPRDAGGGALPMMVYFHAGGYVFGSLDGLDSFCRLMTRETGCLVLSVDYRLAPEHKFPAPLEDAYAATLWASECAADLGADPDRLAVAGDSSGGTIATVVCQLARERGGPAIRHQMLWYPGTGSLGETASSRELGDGYFLTNGLMKWSMGHYLNDMSELTDPRVQPIRLDDMSGLPPAFIMTAGFDPRRDDNRKYAELLNAAGVPTEFRCLDSTIHGFMFMLSGIDVAVEAAKESAVYLRDVFAR